MPVKIDRCEKRRSRASVKSRSPPLSFTPAMSGRIALLQPADHRGVTAGSGNVGEMVEVEPDVGARRSPRSTAEIEAERAFLGDADAIDAGRHEQEAVDLAVERMAGEARDVGDGGAATETMRRPGSMPPAIIWSSAACPVVDGEFRAFAGRPEQRDAVAALCQEHPAMRKKQRGNRGAAVGRDGRGNAATRGNRFREAGHVTSVSENATSE